MVLDLVVSDADALPSKAVHYLMSEFSGRFVVGTLIAHEEDPPGSRLNFPGSGNGCPCQQARMVELTQDMERRGVEVAVVIHDEYRSPARRCPQRMGCRGIEQLSCVVV